MVQLRPICIATVVLIAVSRLAANETVPPRLQFNRDVRPVLSDTCFRCHGPDKASRKADLRLDLPEEAVKPRGKRLLVPISPGHPENSEAYRRLMSNDPDEAMPPPNSKISLTPAQKDILRRWIEQGAEYQPNWAFIPLQRPQTPPATGPWIRNDIDGFVLARLREEGLSPSVEADRPTLIRRLSFDLTGLPPTPAEVEAYTADQGTDAYEKVVDRLLASPRFGERMASDWLDLARFADTHGYQADRYRAMWPYRDWVIKAFNEDMPFDQFGTWQLAGDLLPNASKEQRLATAFNRLHMQNEEGGIVEEEFRVAYVMDRVDTFGTAFLGLTVGCAHCHDHKFDPITQRDFYSLFAFFQNIDESGQTVFFDPSMPVPTLLLSDDTTDAKLKDLHGKISQKQKLLEALRAAPGDAFEKWLNEKGGPASANGERQNSFPFTDSQMPGLAAKFTFEEIRDGKISNLADASKPGIAVENPKLVEGKFGKAAEFAGENGFKFPGIGHYSRTDPFSLAMWLRTPTVDAPRLVVAHHSMAPIDAGSRGYELLLENGHVAFGLHHMWPGNSIKVVTSQQILANEWSHVTVTCDGSSRAAGVQIYIDGRRADLQIVRDGLFKDITYDGGPPDLAVGYRFRDNGFKGGRVDDFCVFSRALTPPEASRLAGRDDFRIAWQTSPPQLSAEQRAGLLEFYLSTASAEARNISADLLALRKQENILINPIPEVMVMEEMSAPKPAYVLKRGQYDMRGEEVSAGTPKFLPPLPAGAAPNRLALARWLFAPQNPLTARVEVNRLWQQMFGKGIVETAENFGSQGSYPTHPELLDWLASEFIRPTGGEAGGVPPRPWDVKRMLRLIALSATYRQSSKAGDDLLARDPADQLLAHAPARRLTAEMLRDQALSVSGLLAEKIGGPSVRPYQPEGLWDVAAGNPAYDQGHGDDLHRRSLYTFWKRTVPPPALMTFDAADRSYCTARRQSTSTPLQALALLNDVQMTEAAKLVSQRMLKEGGPGLDGRLAFAFRLMAGKEPRGQELAILRRLFEEQREIFSADPASAGKLLAVGETKVDPSLDPLDLASGTVLAEALFNFDDVIMRR